MAEGEAETLVLHELGELRAGGLLGPQWEEMLADVGDRRAELMLRAVRDLLADCLVTLPRLVERRADASLRFWRAGFDGLRRALAPELGAAIDDPSARIDLGMLERQARLGCQRWRAAADDLLSAWRRGGQAALKERAAALAPAG